MESAESSARDYRVIDILGNGEAVLDADDSLLAQHRRVVAVSSLPAGAGIGTPVRCYADGRIEMRSMARSTAGGSGVEVADGGEVVQLSPTLGRLIHATVATVAQEFDLSMTVAAHIIMTWIRVEYLL